MNKYSNEEFLNLIQPVLNNDYFQQTKAIIHHGITRYDHCIRVSYFTYKVTKKLHLNYQEATIAALLHDFFTTEVAQEKDYDKLTKHPNVALKNATKYFSLTPMQEDIIKNHMFPITFSPPKYLESWIVDIVDDIAAIYEKSYVTKKELSAATSFLFLIVLNYIRMR